MPTEATPDAHPDADSGGNPDSDSHLIPTAHDRAQPGFRSSQHRRRSLRDGQHPPSSWEAQRDQLTQMWAAEKQAELAGTTGPYSAEQVLAQFDTVMTSMYAQVVKTKLDAAANSTDISVVSDAISTAPSWEREVQLVAGEDKFGQQMKTITEFINSTLLRVFKAPRDACGAGERKLVYSGRGNLGWFIDAAGVQKTLAIARSMSLVGVQSEWKTLDEMLVTCRPRGFKLTTITLHWHWTTSKGVSRDEDRNIKAHVCGSDPTAHPWDFDVTYSGVINPRNYRSGGATTAKVTLVPDYHFETSSTPPFNLLIGSIWPDQPSPAMSIDPPPRAAS